MSVHRALHWHIILLAHEQWKIYLHMPIHLSLFDARNPVEVTFLHTSSMGYVLCNTHLLAVQTEDSNVTQFGNANIMIRSS